MSLYHVQKLLYELNRDEAFRTRFEETPEDIFKDFELSDEEQGALLKPDIGLLYVIGVNGQILMHYAAYKGFAWDEYLQAMRDGIEQHGAVRDGVYAMTTDIHEENIGVATSNKNESSV